MIKHGCKVRSRMLAPQSLASSNCQLNAVRHIHRCTHACMHACMHACSQPCTHAHTTPHNTAPNQTKPTSHPPTHPPYDTHLRTLSQLYASAHAHTFSHGRHLAGLQRGAAAAHQLPVAGHGHRHATPPHVLRPHAALHARPAVHPYGLAAEPRLVARLGPRAHDGGVKHGNTARR